MWCFALGCGLKCSTLDTGLVLAICCYATVMYFVFDALFYLKFCFKNFKLVKVFIKADDINYMAKFCHSYFFIVYVNFVHLSNLKKE